MRISAPSPRPLEVLETLYRQHDGPLPVMATAAVLANGDVGPWRHRAVSAEMDRAVRDLSAKIAARRAHLAEVGPNAHAADETLAALSDGLSDYRAVGFTLCRALLDKR